ncbi:hypothetical protein IKE82_02235 [Candidatus Saccharibacteria bacterium]|nr:hypothetical protein [Candidatus Saccharibacteria bacterium]
MDKKKKIISITVLAVGLIALVAGAVFLIMKLTAAPGVADGEYLVSAGEWVMDSGDCTGEDCGRVVWKFTEIGKGTLTTNAHENDYDFAWAIEDGKLIMQTKWLYEIDNQYDYVLNQEDGILTLTAGESKYRFASRQE